MFKLDKGNVENIIELTSLQQSMLFSYMRAPESRECHEQLMLNLSGDMRTELMEKAWNFAIKQNEALRTVFRWEGIDRPLQIVLREHEIRITNYDFSSLDDKDKALKRLLEEDFLKRINITSETIRVSLCKLDQTHYAMMVTNHHIIYDGWSNGVLIKEVLQNYSELYKKSVPKLVTKTKFSEFVKYTKNQDKNEQKEYWKNYFGLSFDAKCCFEGKESGTHKEIIYRMNHEASMSIKSMAKNAKVSLAALYYTSWGILMQKISGYPEVVFGTTVSGRPEAIRGIDNMVGLFINIVPMVVKNDSKSVIDMVHTADKAIRDRKKYENTPLIDIKKYLGLRTSEELFNSVITIQNYPLSVDNDNILTIGDAAVFEMDNYNIDMQVVVFDDIEFKLKYNSAVISGEMAERFISYLENVVNFILKNGDVSVSNIEIVSKEEKEHILYDFNNNEMDIPEITISQLFEEQVTKKPES
ncbi:MAG: condensation domain-containing protein, partial [Ruminiclostridium sp.]